MPSNCDVQVYTSVSASFPSTSSIKLYHVELYFSMKVLANQCPLTVMYRSILVCLLHFFHLFHQLYHVNVILSSCSIIFDSFLLVPKLMFHYLVL